MCPPACLVLEAQLSGDHLFPISSVPIGRRPVLGQLPSPRPGWAGSGPRFCSMGARLPQASRLSQLEQPHKEPSLQPPAWSPGPPQIINLLAKTFSSSSAPLTSMCKGWNSICCEVLFYFPWRGSEGERSPDPICSAAKHGLSGRGSTCMRTLAGAGESTRVSTCLTLYRRAVHVSGAHAVKARPLNDALSETVFLINLVWFTCTVSGIH